MAQPYGLSMIIRRINIPPMTLREGASTIEKGECLKSWIRSGITSGLPAEVVEQYLEESAVGKAGTTTPSQEGVGE